MYTRIEVFFDGEWGGPCNDRTPIPVGTRMMHLGLKPPTGKALIMITRADSSFYFTDLGWERVGIKLLRELSQVLPKENLRTIKREGTPEWGDAYQVCFRRY